MPKFLERKLEREYGKKSPIVYATLNKLGLMKGNKMTAKGKVMEKKHRKDMGLKGTLHEKGSWV